MTTKGLTAASLVPGETMMTPQGAYVTRRLDHYSVVTKVSHGCTVTRAALDSGWSGVRGSKLFKWMPVT